uniref:Evasin n=1 Tax=Amblyomma triste TaxID=251400 RepID=A0A023G3C3_AMBTT
MHLRGVMMSASILCVVFYAETKVIKDVRKRQGTIWSEEGDMDNMDENEDRYLTGGQTNWKNLSHYEGSMNNTDGVERNGFPGGRTHWKRLPSDEGGTHNVDGVGESSFTGGQNGWASLPPEEDGPNHIDSEEESISHEYYEHTVKATTDGYGRTCHERLFSRRKRSENVPINCLYDCEDVNRLVVQQQYEDQRPCIQISMRDFINYREHVPCSIGVCEKGYCRNATKRALCNPTL